jgi:hypothetical protein
MVSRQIKAIKARKARSAEEVQTYVREIEALKKTWQQDGDTLNGVLAELLSVVKEEDEEIFLSGLVTDELQQAVDDLNAIRFLMLAVHSNPHMALTSQAQEKLKAAQDAFDRICLMAGNDEHEQAILDVIREEANQYMGINYSPEMITTDRPIGRLLNDLEKECAGFAEKPSKEELVSLLQRLIAYKGQWNYENTMLGQIT